MILPEECSTEDSMLILGSGIKSPGLGAPVLHHKHVIAGLNTRASYPYVDSAFSHMRQCVEDVSPKHIFVAMPRHYLAETRIYLRGLDFESVWVLDVSSGEFVRTEW